MESLIIPATDHTPEINFNAGTDELIIRGESRPENVKKFYDPVIDWVNAYHDRLYHARTNNDQRIKTVSLNINLDYLNSSSLKYFYDLLTAIEKLKEYANLKVYWHYNVLDEVMKENGEEYNQMLKGLDIEMVEHSNSTLEEN